MSQVRSRSLLICSKPVAHRFKVVTAPVDGIHRLSSQSPAKDCSSVSPLAGDSQMLSLPVAEVFACADFIAGVG